MAIRSNRRILDAKVDALVALVRELVRKRGDARQKHSEVHRRWVSAPASHGATDWDRPQRISNYLEHICQVPLDEMFRAETL